MTDYSSKSVDITKNCCRYLVENNYYQNNKDDNFDLFKRALVNYSILKFGEFGVDVCQIDIEDWDNFDDILRELDKCIAKVEDKRAFFVQYNHCILYIHSAIQRKSPIKVEIGDKKIVDDVEQPTKIMIPSQLPEYKKTLEIWNTIKNTYEKNPVLRK